MAASSTSSSTKESAEDDTTSSAESSVSIAAEIDRLKGYQKLFLKWRKHSGDSELSSTQLDTIEAAEKLLRTLRDQPLASLTWACVKIEVALLKSHKSSLSSSTLQYILSTFVLYLDQVEKLEVTKTVTQLWQLLCETKHYVEMATLPAPGKYCSLYTLFLQKSFSNFRKKHAEDLMSQIILDSGLDCMLSLQAKSSSAMFEALDLLFFHLVQQISWKAQAVLRLFFKSLGYKISSSIMLMLSPPLLSGVPQEDQYLSHDHVYEVIFELLLINRDLVVGLINNTELCLSPGRPDREKGMRFLCKVFLEKKIPMIPKPTQYFSHLWIRFLGHCRNVSIFEPSELSIIAEYTANFLTNENSYKDWCSLLYHLLQFTNVSKFEKEFVQGVTKAVRDKLELLFDKTPKSLVVLIKNFLSNGSIYRLGDDGTLFLLENLADIYEGIAITWVNRMIPHPNGAAAASKLVELLCVRLDAVCPPVERWVTMYRLFVRNLVPFKQTAEMRMKLLLYFWTNAYSEKGVLEELFWKLNKARKSLKSLLITRFENKSPSEERKKAVNTAARCLQTVLVCQNDSFNFTLEFLRVLQKDQVLTNYVCQLLKTSSSCQRNYETLIKIKERTANSLNETHKQILHGLLYFVCEVICDKESLKILIPLIDSCIMERDSLISQSLGTHHSHVAKSALSLLRVIFVMVPCFAFDTFVLSYLKKWSQLEDEELSTLALRCFSPASSCRKLENWNPDFVREELVPLWERIMSSTSTRRVKEVLKCISFHLAPTMPTRHRVLKNCLEIIFRQLSDQKRQDEFQNAVSALGYMATVCPGAGYTLDHLCLSTLVGCVLNMPHPLPNPDESHSSVADSWTDLDELPFDVSIKVRALRSIGRCMRHVGNLTSISLAFANFEAFLCQPKSGLFENLSDIGYDILRYETAAATLRILERADCADAIPVQLVLALSRLLTDPRVEVRTSLARKLCAGLSPHKERALGPGRSRGALPCYMLGLAALLGSDVWKSDANQKTDGEDLMEQVLTSRSIALRRETQLQNRDSEEMYVLQPHLVPENMLAAAVPVLAEHPSVQLRDAGDDVTEEAAEFIWACVEFLFASLRHPTACASMTRDYLEHMIRTAIQQIVIPAEENAPKYKAVFTALLLKATQYKEKAAKFQIPAQVQLTPPFFRPGVETQDPNVFSSPETMSASISSVVQKLSSSRRKRPPTEFSSGSESESEETSSYKRSSEVSSSEASLEGFAARKTDSLGGSVRMSDFVARMPVAQSTPAQANIDVTFI